MSVCASGTRPGSPSPMPVPVAPPADSDQMAWARWSPPRNQVSQGASHMPMRWPTVRG